jgi:uncharacterized protein YjbI with pentapeptide repeats
VPKYLKWLPSLHEPGPVRLWRIGYALAVCFITALGTLAALWWLAQVLLHHPALPSSKTISVHDTVGVAQLVFASVAGAGALVALVMAYRRQKVAEAATVVDKERSEVEKERWEATAAHDRTRLLNERFTAIATQLGGGQPAVRLAGVHAMAGLADDWKENRQTCVDVLCAYLRLPHDPDPGEDAAPGAGAPMKVREAYGAERAAYLANREVRHTVIRLISAHLRPDAATSWEGLNLDFTGVVFDGGDFSDARFSGGTVQFNGASFASGQVSFTGAEFSDGQVSFSGAEFSGGQVAFTGGVFSDGQVSFYGARFSGGQVSFRGARFSGGAGIFRGEVSFVGAVFSGGQVDFGSGTFADGAVFSGGEVSFASAVFSGGRVSFRGAVFSGGEVSFFDAKFSGGQVDFGGARFSGGEVSFSGPGDWSHPPQFGWENPPAGVTLPAEADAERAKPAGS